MSRTRTSSFGLGTTTGRAQDARRETRETRNDESMAVAARVAFSSWLRAGREAREMSVEDVARVTKIPARTLTALESAKFEGLPAEVFVRGFIKSYARCVGLDGDDAVRRYQATARGAVVSAFFDTVAPLAPSSAARLTQAPVVQRQLAAPALLGLPAPEIEPELAPEPASDFPALHHQLEAAFSGNVEVETEVVAEGFAEVVAPEASVGIVDLAVTEVVIEAAPEPAAVVAALAPAPSRGRRKKSTSTTPETLAGAVVGPAPRTRRRKAASADVNSAQAQLTQLGPVEAVAPVAQIEAVASVVAASTGVSDPVSTLPSEPVLSSDIAAFAAPSEAPSKALAAVVSAPSGEPEAAGVDPNWWGYAAQRGARVAVRVAEAPSARIARCSTPPPLAPVAPVSAMSATSPFSSAELVVPVVESALRPLIRIDDDNPDAAEAARLARIVRAADTDRDSAPKRGLFPTTLFRRDRAPRQGGLTLAVIILLIAATLTLSYLMRRPDSSGEGVTQRTSPASPAMSVTNQA